LNLVLCKVFMLKNFLNNRGFSLIELTIVIAVMAVMSTTSFTAYLKAKQIDDVFAAAYQLASDIRTVQNYALGGKQNTANTAVGWGIFFDEANEKYYICFDDNGDNNPSIDKVVNAYNTTTLNNNCVKNENLALKKLLISNVLRNSAGSNLPRAQIVFKAPDPKISIISYPVLINVTTINGSMSLSLEIQAKNNPAVKKTITMNKFGLIEVK